MERMVTDPGISRCSDIDKKYTQKDDAGKRVGTESPQ